MRVLGSFLRVQGGFPDGSRGSGVVVLEVLAW